MTTQHRASLVCLAVAGLIVACGDPAGLDPRTSRDVSPIAAKQLPIGQGPLHIKAEYNLATVDEKFIREVLEITAYITSYDPIDPKTGLPFETIALNFETITQEYQPQGKTGSVKATVKAGWEIKKSGDGFTFETTDPQAVADYVIVEEFESGQAVADLTGYIAAVEGQLTFHPDLKLWRLRLGFLGIVTPSGIITPAMLKTIAGSAVATLEIEQTKFTAQIRENEAAFQSTQLEAKAETEIREEGPDAVREIAALLATFASSELQPDPQLPFLEDLQFDFEINFAGAIGPSCVRFVIPGSAWVPGDGGGFAIEQFNWPAAGIKVVVVHQGQIVADLTQEIAGFKAGLRFLPAVQSWELELGIAGIVIPSDIHEPILAPIAGARLAAVEVGAGLEHFSARLLKNEAIF